MAEKLIGSLQENLLTLIAHDDEWGKIAAGIVSGDLFEGDLRIIAEKVLAYWRAHGEAPKLHTSDLLSDIIEDPRNKKAASFKRTLRAMSELAQSINGKYVVDKASVFVRQQEIKDAVYRSAELLSAPGESGLEQVEAILHDILKARNTNFDPGMRATEWGSVIHYLQTHYDEFDTGIPYFDKHYVVPNRGALYQILGEYGAGKTWAGIHMGKRALMRRKRVLHVTTEVAAEEVLLRYYQGLFSVPKHSPENARVVIPVFETEENDDGGVEIAGLGKKEVRPDFAFDWDSINTEMETHVERMHATRLRNLYVKRFAPRQITTQGLRAFMDSLEQTEGFIPDMLVMDSGYLLKMDVKDPRIALGRAIEDLRAIGIERNMAVVNTHQLNRIPRRESVSAGNRASTSNVAEDISIAWTADIVITMDSTEAERAIGLARLFADKVRSDKGGQAVVITQAYQIGQFVLNSLPLTYRYNEIVNNVDVPEDGAEDEADE